MLHQTIPGGLSPLSPEQNAQMAALLPSLSPVQQAWISGYLAASAMGAQATLPPVAATPSAAATLTVLYGSQTGNAKHVAQDLAAQAQARGLEAKVVNMADYKPTKLKDETHLAIVVSTYGEGEPPESAQKLYDFLASKKAPKLDGVEIAVLGLGDTSYEHFCQTAVDFEDRLTALGATVKVEKALLDVDYDDHAAGWITGAIDALEPGLTAGQGNVVPLMPAATPAAPLYSKKNPFEAEVTVVQKITGRDSTKDVRHIELSLEGSGITYQPGDSLGVYFENDPVEVDTLLATLGLSGSETVKIGDAEQALRTALIEIFELTQSYPGFVQAYADATGNDALTARSADKDALRDYLADRQIYDVIQDHPAAIAPQALADALRKMQPRLYSIASSQAEVEDEVHLTLGVVSYDAFGRPHLGGASGHLAHRVAEGDTLRVYVEHNDGFRLPQDPATPVIMVGPGTGIAPFRAFLQDREAQGAEGGSWLFFGNPHFTQDFLYQTELQAALKSGTLTKLSVAFSRDQAQKIYVQDRIREEAATLWTWLQKGAHLYICGDGQRMARDVEDALIAVIAAESDITAEAAQAYLTKLRDEGRYQRDVY
ncbi:MAG: assimilatory sulfite reductase (NADPH) flavoprotein subunit [Pseudomonadota bacterium]